MFCKFYFNESIQSQLDLIKWKAWKTYYTALNTYQNKYSNVKLINSMPKFDDNIELSFKEQLFLNEKLKCEIQKTVLDIGEKIADQYMSYIVDCELALLEATISEFQSLGKIIKNVV